MAWTSPRTWTAGEVPTAAIFNSAVRDNLKALTEYAAWTPTITNVTSSTVTARYVSAGKLVMARGVFTLTGAPSGVVTVSLPVTASTVFGTGVHHTIGTVTGLRSGVSYRVGSAYLASATTIGFVSDAAVGAWDATTPVTWVANTDIWAFNILYEAA